MITAKIVNDPAETVSKTQRVYGNIACLLMCLGIVVSLFGKSIGLESHAKLFIQSGLGLIGTLIYIFADIIPKLNLFLCGVFSTVFIINLIVIIW